MTREAPSMRFDLKIEKMTAEQIGEIENWMKHDKKWQFLRKNENLVDTIRRDADTLARIGISPDNVANRLASLINAFHFTSVNTRLHTFEEIQEVEKRGRLIEDRYFVQVIEELEYTERQPCYFEVLRNTYSLQELFDQNREAGEDEMLSKRIAVEQYLSITKHTTASAMYRIVDVSDKKWRVLRRSLEFPAVMIHSIRKHHFFGGPNARRRVDPKEVTEFLAMEPGKEYSSGRQEMDTWFQTDHTSSLTVDYRHSSLVKKYGDRIPLQEGLIAYIWVQDGVILSDRDRELGQPLTLNGVVADLKGKEIHRGQTIIKLNSLFFDIG